MSDINPDDLILMQVHVCHRHGDRSTAFRVPFDDKQVKLEEELWKPKILDKETKEKLNELFPNNGCELPVEDENIVFGKLIKEGLECLIQLGKKLNERYVQTNFLHFPFQEGEIKCYSTNSYRTYESIQGLLLGLLELSETTTAALNKREKWFPTIKVMRKPPQPLNPHDDYSWKLFNKPELQRKIHENSKEYDRILPELRKYIYSDKKYEYMRFRDYFYCMDLYNIPIQKEIQCYKDIVIKECSNTFCLTYQNKELGKYRMEYYLSKIYHQMINCKHHFNNLKFTVTSCHDNSILSLLSLFKPELCMVWPDYGASVIFELFKSERDDNFYIKILYNFETIFIEKQSSVYIPLETFPLYFM